MIKPSSESYMKEWLTLWCKNYITTIKSSKKGKLAKLKQLGKSLLPKIQKKKKKLFPNSQKINSFFEKIISLIKYQIFLSPVVYDNNTHKVNSFLWFRIYYLNSILYQFTYIPSDRQTPLRTAVPKLSS